MKKPLGIKIIIALNLLSGLAALVISVIVFSSLYGSDDQMSFLIPLVPLTLIVLIFFMAAYGLWRIKKWGPNLSKWIYLFGAFISLIALVKPFLSDNAIEIGDFLESIVFFLIAISIARYLSRKSIKEMYQEQT